MCLSHTHLSKCVYYSSCQYICAYISSHMSCSVSKDSSLGSLGGNVMCICPIREPGDVAIVSGHDLNGVTS